ncbi:unnamed protein product [Amoebophrya sp. A25]|nr:unnamed protein product [Amoebophrya sp. A25]|eukprot:GSA25T00013164001.1
MKAKRYRREPYQEAFVSESIIDSLQQSTVLISKGAVVLRGAKLARLLRFSSGAVGTWGKLGALIGGRISERLFQQDSPRSAGAAAAGSWIGSVAGASIGASVVSGTTTGASTVASAGTVAYAIGSVEAASLASSILAATSLGAAGAVVGAGAALLIKNKLLATESGAEDRTSSFLERELHLFAKTAKLVVLGADIPSSVVEEQETGEAEQTSLAVTTGETSKDDNESGKEEDEDNFDTQDPFGHLGVILGFDDVESGESAVPAQLAHGWYTIPISPQDAGAKLKKNAPPAGSP